MNSLRHRPFAWLLAGALCVGWIDLAFAGPGDGMVVGATKIFDSGPAGDRFNLVLVAEGYQEGEQADFAADAEQFLEFFVETPPFDATCRAFNVWRLDVTSTESGADDPTSDDAAFCVNATGAEKDTFFDARFCDDGKIRRLLGVDDAAVIAALDAEVPEWDQAIVIVNSNIYGGQGGTPGTTSLSGTWENIAIHEIGHSVFGLADEYEYFAGCSSGETDRDNHPASEPAQVNVTIESDPTLVKWSDLVDPSMPTTMNADCSMCDPQPNPVVGQVVGVYEGAHYYHCDAFRPVFSCMMRDYADFCPVCTKKITDDLADFLPENEAPTCDAGGPYEVECNGFSPTVMLDGSGSADDGCLPLTWTWSGNFTGGVVVGESPTVQFAGVGDETVSLEVSDSLLSSECEAMVSITDTTEPEIVAPEDVTAECAGPDGTPVDLGSPVVSDICDASPGVTNDAPALFPLGVTVVTWTAEDASSNSADDTQTVTIEDTTPPEITLSVAPTKLWPPNHKLVEIVATIEVEDVCDPDPIVRLVSISSDEPEDDLADGATSGDIEEADLGTDDRAFELRAERQGKGDGRVYTIVYEVEDASGNVAQAEAEVRVQKSKKP